jgi:hypothetical protein
MSEVSEHKAIVVAAITPTQDCHLFPTVSKVDVQNILPWRESGSVVQLAFMLAKLGADTREQHGKAKGLGHVTVGARF